MNLGRAIATDGWMEAAELEYLAQAASKCKLIAELGSWKGRSSLALAQNTQGTVFCIDKWGGNALTGGEYGAAGSIFAEFQANIHGIPNIVPVTLDTMSAARSLGNVGLRFDMVFIDACHTYEAVKADIENWRELLTPQGILCGHDFFGDYPGVARAVRELLMPFRLVNSIWTTEEA